MRNCAASLHGTTHAYWRRGCRCPEAVAAVRAEGRRKTAKRCRSLHRVSLCRTGYDEMAIVRAIRGDLSIVLTMPELDEAVDRLDALGWTAERIARHLGITSRTVVRRRAERRLLAEENGAAALPGYRANQPASRQANSLRSDATSQVRQETAA